MSAPGKVIITCAVTGVDPDSFEPFLRPIKQRSTVILTLTARGSPFMSAEERNRSGAVWKPEVASPDEARDLLTLKRMGSVAF
jgi:uncharacterized protein (DUF849 family)